MTAFSALSLGEPILRALDELNFEKATEIQAQTIPALSEGRDVIGIAKTGGGKTAAFSLPILQRMLDFDKNPEPGKPRAVILAPTRELALQISQAISTFSKHMRVRHTAIFGGAAYRDQFTHLKRGVDILVATPGRLMDHMERGSVDMSDVEFFVLDEADRMLDMGFVDDVKTISEKMPSARQTILFSATMSRGVRDLAQRTLNNPLSIETSGDNKVSENVDHKLMFVNRNDKFALLHHVVSDERAKRFLVFTRTKRGADEVCEELEQSGYRVDALHGDKQQRTRQRIIKRFKDGNIDALVATDVAARGIDVSDITHVFNYDLPMEPDNYIHRVGRTGRASKTGKAFSFCSKGETVLLRDIERLLGEPLEVVYDQPFHANVGNTKSKSGGKGNFKGRSGNSNYQGRGDKPWKKKANDGRRSEGGNAHEDKPWQKKPYKGKSDDNKSYGDKPAWKKRDDRSFGDKPAGEKSWKKRDDRSFGDKPAGDKPAWKKRDDRSFGDKPAGEKSWKKRDDRSFGDKPAGDKPAWKKRDNLSSEDNSAGDQSWKKNPNKGKRDAGKPAGERSFGDKPGKGAFKGKAKSKPKNKSFKGKPQGDGNAPFKPKRKVLKKAA